MGYSIMPTVEDRALTYFVCNYNDGIRVPGEGFFDHLDLYYSSISATDPLVTSIKAVGLAGYAHHVQSTKLVNASRYQYIQAVQLTNNALRSPEDAIKDSTLISITILGMYELLTGGTNRSLKAWAEHVNGAAALLKLRGIQQLATPMGRRLFAQVTNELVTTCLQRNMRLPEHIIQMVTSLGTLTEYNTRAVDVMVSIMNVNQFRAAVEDKSITDPYAILEKALELDGALKAITDDPPSIWQYLTVSVPSAHPDEIFNGRCHIYKDPWSVNIWNGLRISRILLHFRIRATLLEGFAARPPAFTTSEYTVQFQRSTDACYELQAEILASIPQLLGFAPPSQPSRNGLREETLYTQWDRRAEVAKAGRLMAGIDDPSDILTPPYTPQLRHSQALTSKPISVPHSNGYALLWPLWLAGDMDLATPEVQQYCARTLRRIARDLGISQAKMLARAIESRMDIEF